jgi:hypothetical protein
LSGIEALKAARAAGIELALDGNDLALSAISAPPAAMLDELSRHKAEIVALLRPGRDGWSGEDWLAFFDERAGIAEFEGGLPRGEAEARAFECCAVEWLNRNPVCSTPDTWNPFVGAASTAATFALIRMRLRSTITVRPMRTSTTHSPLSYAGRKREDRSQLKVRSAIFVEREGR